MSFPIGIGMVSMQKIALDQVGGVIPTFRIPNLRGRAVQAGLWYLIFCACCSVITIPATVAYQHLIPTSDITSVFWIIPVEFIAFLILDVVVLITMLIPLLIVEKGLFIKDAFAENLATVKPHFWNLYWALILCHLFSVVGMLACCVGIFFTAIAGYLFPAVIYYYMVNQTRLSIDI